ncbi:Hypothetical protein A7982_08522 [Minicystis rosea]|nr:Hypothetical protein A7982_08522 [Minicystis rosea]
MSARTPIDPGPEPTFESWPTGRPVVSALERPLAASVPVVACSFDEPVCVRAAPSVNESAILSTIRNAEAALRGYRALGLPSPLTSVGGPAAYDIYLVPGTEAPITIGELAPNSDGWDRASAFTILPPPSSRAGCEAPFHVAQSIADAIALRFDAGVEDGARTMSSSYLASIVAPCANVELAAVDDFQRHPERSFVAGDPGRADGALLFPWFLDEAYGRRTPGRVMASLIALSSQRTPPGSWSFRNEPDVFDALRATMKDRGSTLDQLLLDFAVARAFVGSRSDGGHLTDVERFGDFGRVRFEWSVTHDSLPRRLAPRGPIDPMGMTYLWVDTSSAPPSAELTFVADWELPSVFRWSLVKIDKNGAEAGRFDAGGIFGASHVEKTVVGVDGLAGVLVVGVNAESMDRSHPFDPDEQPLMGHGYTVMLVK